jgi:GNAT superfamily N-acetyltransferase
MWKTRELDPTVISADVGAGLCFLAEITGEAAGTMKFQLEDELFWPDLAKGEACYVHRLAVRRRFAGMGVSSALLAFAAVRARSLGRAYLRLDCESNRARLRTLYERFGFRHHSER